MKAERILVELEVTDAAGLIEAYRSDLRAAFTVGPLKGLPPGALVARYAGSGDSGEVTEIVFEPEDPEASSSFDPLAEGLWTRLGKARYANGRGEFFAAPRYELSDHYRCVREIVEEMALMAVEVSGYPGWEVNDGSEGELRLSVPGCELTLAHTEFYVASQTTAVSFDDLEPLSEQTFGAVPVSQQMVSPHEGEASGPASQMGPAQAADAPQPSQAPLVLQGLQALQAASQPQEATS